MSNEINCQRQRTPLQEFVSKAETVFMRSPSRILQSKYAESYVSRIQYQSPLKSVTAPEPQQQQRKENSHGLTGSPMQWMSPVTPPPSFSRVPEYRNPFDANGTEHLHLEAFSPSVFSRVLSPSEDQDSNWRIEHVALLNPTDFSPSLPHGHSHSVDPNIEAEAQEKILQFFSQKQIAPSPWSQPRSRFPPRSKTKTPAQETTKPAPQFKNARTQTALSLPPDLPAEVEAMLSRFTTQDPCDDGAGRSPQQHISSEGDDSSLLNASSLRRKLFSQADNDPPFKDETSPASPVLPTGPLSCRFSFSPVSQRPPVSPPALSPIALHGESAMAVDETTRNSSSCGCVMEIYESGCLNCSATVTSAAREQLDVDEEEVNTDAAFASYRPVECSTPTKSNTRF